jgi:hypothetical protein
MRVIVCIEFDEVLVDSEQGSDHLAEINDALVTILAGFNASDCYIMEFDDNDTATLLAGED